MDELQSYLALAAIASPWHIKLVWSLLARFSTPNDLLSSTSSDLKEAGANPSFVQAIKKLDKKAIENCLIWGSKPNRTMIHWNDCRYPELLRQIATPPLVLFVEGNASLLKSPQLAIVGSRRPTPLGIAIASQFASELAQQGFTVTSGLARGIDGAGHRGALQSGYTIAVLGSGLDQLYPSIHKTLAARILERDGALLSEFFPCSPPKAEHFPQRNRIISGLSLGVLVVEAALKSGSLITARYGLEQGREVFAIPGSIYNPLSKGCHALIKQGASLVETSSDIIQELNLSLIDKDYLQRQQISLDFPSHPMSNITQTQAKLDSNDKKLVECVGFEVTSLEILSQRSGQDVSILLGHLAQLELKGYIKSEFGGYIRIS